MRERTRNAEHRVSLRGRTADHRTLNWAHPLHHVSFLPQTVLAESPAFFPPQVLVGQSLGCPPKRAIEVESPPSGISPRTWAAAWGLWERQEVLGDGGLLLLSLAGRGWKARVLEGHRSNAETYGLPQKWAGEADRRPGAGIFKEPDPATLVVLKP